jgi:hypothetical protein
MINELKKREKELLKMAFMYWKRFNLDQNLIKNCIFHRQLKWFIRAFKEFTSGDAQQSLDNKQIFHEKAVYIMKLGGNRVQSAVLSYLSQNNAIENALEIALEAEIPKDQWPEHLNYTNEQLETAKKNVLAS